MKYCIKCKVHIRTDSDNCPLCQRPVNGGTGEQIYPKSGSKPKDYEEYFKRVLLITAAVAIISTAINALFPTTGFWALIVIIGLACFWAFFLLVVYKKDNISKNITFQVFYITTGCVAWDLATGWSGWSLDYVFPIVCVLAVMSMFVVAKVMKLNARDYVVFLFTDAAFGILPLVFYLLKLTNVVYPSIIGSSLSLLSLVSILIYQWRFIRLEFSKRFHL